MNTQRRTALLGMLGLAIAACSSPKKRKHVDEDEDDERPQRTSPSSSPSTPKPGPTKPIGPGDPIIGPNDPPIIPFDKLEHATVSPAEGTLTGVLEARSVITHSGCADRGTARKWLVVASGGKFYPSRS